MSDIKNISWVEVCEVCEKSGYGIGYWKDGNTGKLTKEQFLKHNQDDDRMVYYRKSEDVFVIVHEYCGKFEFPEPAYKGKIDSKEFLKKLLQNIY